MNRRPPATPEQLLDDLADVHPSMVPAYLAEGILRTLVEIRDDIRSTMPRYDRYDDDDQAAALPEQRTEPSMNDTKMVEI